MLTVNQQRNLEAAVRAATTAPSASNPLTTAAEVTAAQAAVAALQPWQENAGVVEVKSTFGANGVKVAVPSQTFICNTEAQFTNTDAPASPAVNVLWSTNTWANNTSNGANLALGASATASGAYTPAAVAFDGNTATGWSSGANGIAWVRCNLGSKKSFNKFVINGHSSANIYYELTKIEVSDDDISWDTLWSGTASMPSSISGSVLTIVAAGSAQFIRFTINGFANWGEVAEIKLYNSTYYDVDNYFATDDLVDGGAALTFDATSLVVKTLSSAGSTISGAGVVNVAYRTSSGAAYSTPVDLETFRAVATAPVLANCTWLQLQFQLVGAQTLGYAQISTAATSGLMTKAGNMTLTGDVSIDDAVLTGDLTMDTTKTTIAQIAATTDTTSATTIKSIAVPANKTINIDADVIGNKAGASKAAYRILGTFYRNAGGDIVQLGETLVFQENEIVAGWNADFTLTQTPDYTVNVQVTGEASVAWSAKITYNLV